MDNYKQEFTNYTVLDSQQTTAAATGTVAKKFMANVFAWMFIAIGISTLMSLLFANVESFRSLLYVETTKGMAMSGLGTIPPDS